MLIYFFVFILAFSLTIYLVPIIKRAAERFGMVDYPDGKLKNQSKPVPYLGGLAIAMAFLLTLAITFEFEKEVLGLLLAGSVMVILGLIDDFKVLKPKIKFLGQLFAVIILLKAGIYIKLTIIPIYISIPISIIWLIGITNAFNIIDIMDGLSAGIGFCASLVLFGVAILNNNSMIAIMTIALAGSLFGFLRYNFEPAKIYMGDTGSMFIGLMLGALAMVGRYTEVNNVAPLAPILILGVPIFDTLFVMYIRWRRGQSVFIGSADHFALRLRKWKFTTRQTVLLSCGISLLLGLAGLVMMQVSNEIAGGIFLIIILMALFSMYFLRRIGVGL